MTRSLSFLALGISLLTLGLFLYSPCSRPCRHTAEDNAFDRVMREGVLRCAYYVFPPATYRDPNTGALTGLSVDMAERLASSANVKVEWTEEINFGSWQPGLKAKRFDAVCTPMWPDPSVAREALFTRPMFYAGIHAYARGNDRRFDNNLNAVDSPAVTIAVQESAGTASLAAAHFPRAKILTVPQNAPAGTDAQNVLAHKADIVLWDENGVFEFSKKNPGGLHNVAPGRPVKVMPFALMVGLNEHALRAWLDVGLETLENTGETNRLLDRWEVAPNSFFRMARPYLLPVRDSAALR